MPELKQEPFAAMHRGAFAASLVQPVAEDYHISADFELDPPSGGTLTGSDKEQIEGKYGSIVALEYFVHDRISLLAGLDFRMYDIRGELKPPELTLPVSVDGVNSLQAHGGFRMYFDSPPEMPRLRPFLGAQVAYLSGVDIDVSVDLDEFIPGESLNPSGTGEDLWMLGLAGGAIYQWSDHLFIRAGAVWEHSLTELEADLPIELEGLTADPIPFRAAFKPSGPMVFVGATWFF